MIKGISLFSNVGIAETYLKDVGVDIVLANELIEKRARFYKHLYPECEVINGDITDAVVFDRIISRAMELNVEFLIATPPCQGMSIAGLMNPYDERNSLVKYAIDAIELIKPKYVLLENVPQQLVTPICYDGGESLIPEYIMRRLSNSYNICVEPKINTADYGVPQRRDRAIFLMTRKDCLRTWEFPEKERHWINLEEAFNGIPDLWPIESLKTYNPHGVCIYKAGGDIVDRQVLAVRFKNGSVATHTVVLGAMKPGRSIWITGTEGEIEGNAEDGVFYLRKYSRKNSLFEEEKFEFIDKKGETGGHFGGDKALVRDFCNLLNGGEKSISCTSIEDSINGHLLVYAADKSMRNNDRIQLSALKK